MLDLEQLAVQYNVLKREMESDQAVYESVLTRIKQVDVSKGMEAPPIWAHQLAMVPTAPVSPNARQLLTTSTGGGFMLGLAIIGLIVLQDRSIRTLEDARDKLRTPVLGLVTNIQQDPQQARRTKEAAVKPELLLQMHRNIAEGLERPRSKIRVMRRAFPISPSCRRDAMCPIPPNSWQTATSTSCARSLLKPDLIASSSTPHR